MTTPPQFLTRLRQTDPVFKVRAWDQLCRELEAAVFNLQGTDAAVAAALGSVVGALGYSQGLKSSYAQPNYGLGGIY